MASRVGLVVVSHSRALGEAARELAGAMLQGDGLSIAVAAGLDDGTLGTDAVAISEAIGAVDGEAGVVVLMDLGSAVLSAELALELLEDGVRERVELCPAPLVEGLVVGAVAAAGGASRSDVAAEAMRSLAAKVVHLVGETDSSVDSPDLARGEAADAVDTFQVVDEHGLHARPVARLVEALAGYDADVQLVNATTGAGPAPVTSPSAVASLGAARGHWVEIRARGPQAAAAVARVLELAAGAADDDQPAGDVPARSLGTPTPLGRSQGTPTTTTSALGASSGAASGPAYVWQPRGVRLEPTGEDSDHPPLALGTSTPIGASQGIPMPSGAGQRGDDSLAELTTARERVRADIEAVRDRVATELGTTEAAIFDAHLTLLDDSYLLGLARTAIEAGTVVADAWNRAVTTAHDQLAKVEDAYLQARAADVLAVGDAVLRALLDEPEDRIDGDGILVADDLTPAQLVALDLDRIAGLLLAAGSAVSHSMILARARGLPAVVGAGAAALDLAPGVALIIDGETGAWAVEGPDAK